MRQFVSTWWGGWLRDTFGSRSIYRCARWGRLRVRARGCAEVVRRKRRAAAAVARSEA